MPCKIYVKQNVRVKGRVHPEKILSQGRAGDYGGQLASCLKRYQLIQMLVFFQPQN